jgi:hypothetical protein
MEGFLTILELKHRLLFKLFHFILMLAFALLQQLAVLLEIKHASTPPNERLNLLPQHF